VATIGCILPLAGRGRATFLRGSFRTEIRVAEVDRLELYALASAASRLARLEGENWGIVERNEWLGFQAALIAVSLFHNWRKKGVSIS